MEMHVSQLFVLFNLLSITFSVCSLCKGKGNKLFLGGANMEVSEILFRVFPTLKSRTADRVVRRALKNVSFAVALLERMAEQSAITQLFDEIRAKQAQNKAGVAGGSGNGVRN